MEKAMPRQADPSESRRRALLIAGATLLVTCVSTFDAFMTKTEQLDSFDIVRISMVMLLSLVLALRSTTGFTIRREQPELGDELVRANRASAALWGFGTMFLGAIIASIAGFVTAMPLARAAPLILVAGAVAATARFTLLEARGQTGE